MTGATAVEIRAGDDARAGARLLEDIKARLEQAAAANPALAQLMSEEFGRELTDTLRRLRDRCPELFGTGMASDCSCWKCSYCDPFADGPCEP